MHEEIVIREYIPGDPSKASHFYYTLFDQQFNFTPISEKYFMNSFLDIFNYSEGSMLWIVEKNNQIMGTIGIINKGNSEAQLRWFSLDSSLQGLGIGNKLMELAMAFCQSNGYRHVILWTINILKPARHLYAKFGFKLTETKINNEWASTQLLEEKWDYFEKKI